MSFYMANAQKIKIKPELQEDFGYLFNEKYEQIQILFLKNLPMIIL